MGVARSRGVAATAGVHTSQHGVEPAVRDDKQVVRSSGSLVAPLRVESGRSPSVHGGSSGSDLRAGLLGGEQAQPENNLNVLIYH